MPYIMNKQKKTMLKNGTLFLHSGEMIILFKDTLGW